MKTILRALFEDGTEAEVKAADFEEAVARLRFACFPSAQGTEAQRAETVKQGSVHDGPVRDSECAQKP